MTQEQLDNLAAARQKANAVKQAMKEGKEEEMISILQAKIDKIKMNEVMEDLGIPSRVRRVVVTVGHGRTRSDKRVVRRAQERKDAEL